MFPILYENITAGVVPEHRGLGTLSDCISCVVEQERNGAYELVIEYPASGIRAKELAYRRIIKAKPNFTDNPQLFRIDRIGKVMNGSFTVYAKHISYDLSGCEITSGTANSATTACALLQGATTGYTITTDKTVTANFAITEPSSVRSWFGGKSGSFLDVFGEAEIVYDNFNIQFKLHAGQDRGVTIRYKKNLLELSQEIDCSNLYTHVICFYKDDTTMVVGSKMPTGLTLDVERTLILDVSSDYEEPPTNSELTTKAQSYINNHNLTTPSNNIKLDFVQSGELANRVDLCDTVNVYYEALGITRAEVKCIRTKYDVIREKYVETEFGDAKFSIADSILDTSKAIAKKPSSTYMETAIRNATQLITGNLGGHVVIHDSNSDGEPDEILVMNTNDINTATKVWRLNLGGFGYSSTGYDGQYGTAITMDGAIVANFITAGEMSGNRVRTGAIVSQNNQLVMDLDNGTITAPAITLNGEDVGSRLEELEQTSVDTKYALSNSGTVVPSAFPLTAPTQPTEAQPYLWTRTIYTYANGQSNTSYLISVRGANGQDGQDGQGLEILGSYDTMADLIADHPTGSAGDAYMVGTDLVVWDTTNSQWKDVGRIQGANGADGLWLAIDNDDDGTLSNVTYNAHLLRGNSDVTNLYHSVFAWYLVKEAGITEIATGTSSITVSRDSADYGATIRCVCIAIVDEEDMEDYTYVPITDYDGNIIQIIGTNNVKLIGESAIYKPYAISSQFQVLSDEISSKVSQTDFNSLSNTVTSQGTAIQQNAQAITLKANQSTVNTLSNTVSSQGTAIEQNAQQITLKANTSDVNQGLSGKMATDMSNRTSSITINSGEIKFESNSVSISSTNLTVTKTGSVTAVNFMAKRLLRVVNDNNVVLASIEPTANGGMVAVGMTDTTQVGTLWALADGGHFALSNSSKKVTVNLSGANGHLSLGNSSGTQTITARGDTGNITASGNINATGKITGGSFGAVNSSGTVSATGNVTATGDVNGTTLRATGNVVAAGAILSGGMTATGAIVCGGITAKTQVVAADSSGNTRVFFNAGTYGYGAFKNSNGDNNIYLRGDTGNVECVSVTQTSSRKVKENIKPIEDSEKILLLDAVSFDYKDRERGTDKRGFIAEDVAEVLPNLVSHETEDRPASLDYIGMIPYLQDIIKKQEERIKTLEEKIDKLMEKEK